MNAPEDVACEKYFTPPDRRTLSEMLRESLFFEPTKQITINKIKTVFKEWLQQVAIGKETPDTIRARKDFIMLIDEP